MKKQNILITVFVVVLAGAAYNIYQYTGSTQSGDLLDKKNQLESNLNNFRGLRNSQLDVSIFQDPEFSSLKNFAESSTLPPSPVPGKINPFSPF